MNIGNYIRTIQVEDVKAGAPDAPVETVPATVETPAETPVLTPA